MSDFEELTSLTALLGDDSEANAKPRDRQSKTAKEAGKAKQAKGNSAKGTTTKGKQTKEGKAKQRKRKRYTSSTTPEQVKPVEEGPKVMTSIIISEEARDWLKRQGLSTKLSMSQQIDLLVRQEMKRRAKD